MNATIIVLSTYLGESGMSLPSVVRIARERNCDTANCSQSELESLLIEAMKCDLPLAVQYLHSLSHQVSPMAPAVSWLQDPNSSLGKQLIRLHASDALRPLAAKHFCHGQTLTFLNCCGGIVGTPPSHAEVLRLQVLQQNGVIAYADC